MNANEVLQHCQAYLDGQLDPERKVRIEAHLAANPETASVFEEQRRFRAFVKKALAHVKAPDAVKARLKARIASLDAVAAPAEAAPVRAAASSTEAAFAPPPPARRRPLAALARPLALAAALMFAVAGAIAMQTQRICPYVAACANEHGRILRGEDRLAIRTQQPAQLIRYVSDQVEAPLPALPRLDEYQLKPVGAGRVSFPSLAAAPAGAFVKYEGAGAVPLTLLIQKWPQGQPLNLNYDAEHDLWIAEHGKVGVVCWRSPNGQMLCAVAARRPLPQMLTIALLAREALKP